jgi:hypothetical protein
VRLVVVESLPTLNLAVDPEHSWLQCCYGYALGLGAVWGNASQETSEVPIEVKALPVGTGSLRKEWTESGKAALYRWTSLT